MLDAVENSLREAFQWAAERACSIPPEVAHLVGEVAAEAWYRSSLPTQPADRALWLKGAKAVLPLIPLAPPNPTFFCPSSTCAIQGARRIIDLMICQALDQCGHTVGEVDLTLVSPSSSRPAPAQCDATPPPETMQTAACAARGPYRR